MLVFVHLVHERLPCDARDEPALHRMTERVLSVAVKGLLRRAARALDGIGSGDNSSS